MDELTKILQINDIDIALITEIYPKNNDKSIDLTSFNCFNIEGYNYLFNKHGRGVGMFVKCNIDPKRQNN